MENEKRVAEFRRNPKLEQLLGELNGLLSVCQESVNQKYENLRFPILLWRKALLKLTSRESW